MAESEKFEIKDNILIKYLGNEINVTIPDGIKRIGKYAFNDCKDIQSVAIPNSVEVIEQAAFLGCGKLNNVVLPENLKYIENSAFFNCSNLTDINIPNSVTEIGEQTFSGCIKLQSVKLPEGLNIVNKGVFSYCEELKNIDIPNSVTCIDDKAFCECIFLESINMGSGLDKIGKDVFFNCNKLIIKEMPETIKEIGSNSFYGCNLDNIKFPMNLVMMAEIFEYPKQESISIIEGIRNIPKNAFSNCSLLKHLYIPASVGTIESCAFDDCCNLESISVDQNNEIYCYANNMLCNKKTKEVVFIPDLNKKKISFPDGIEIIPNNTFSRNYKFNSILECIEIPSSVVKIESNAFEKCYHLESFNVSNDNNCFFSRDGIIYNKSKTEILFVPKNIKGDISILEGITTIPQSAFYNRKKLRHINLPRSLNEIKNYAFEDCTSLCDLEIKENVKNIGSLAFNGCDMNKIKIHKEFTIRKRTDEYGRVSDIVIPILKTENNSYDSNSNEITIPEGITVIEKNTFSDFKNLENITIPNSVFRIEDNAFSGCSKLKIIVIPSSVNEFGKDIFKGCSNLERFVLENEKTKLKYNWFDDEVFVKIIDDYSPNQIEIGDDIYNFYSALHNDSVNKKTQEKFGYYSDNLIEERLEVILKKLNLKTEMSFLLSICFKSLMKRNEELSFMMDKKFLQLYEIEDIISKYIKDSIKSAATSLFRYYDSIPTVEELDKVLDQKIKKQKKAKESKELGKNILEKNWNYKKLENGTLKITGYNGIESEITVPSIIENMKVSEISAKAFSPIGVRTEEQKTIRNNIKKVKIPQGIETIGNNAFKDCKSITEIILPESIKNIGVNCFQNCKKLSKIEINEENTNFITKDGILYNRKDKSILGIPMGLKGRISLLEGLSKIDEDAFADCKDIIEINIPKTVLEIGNGAFGNCKKLEIVKFSEGIINIPFYAFRNCSKLSEITIPKSVIYIDDTAFEGTENLMIVGEKGSYAEEFVKSNFSKYDIYEDARESYWDMDEYERSFSTLDEHIEFFVEENSWKYSISFMDLEEYKTLENL